MTADYPSPASLRFCLLCDKPFTGESSYNRHVAYCRRVQNRPRNRQRSCYPCSLAKTKCSFHARCTRCVAKGLECVYDRPPVAHKTKPLPVDTSTMVPAWPPFPTDDPPYAFEFEQDASMADLSHFLAVSESDSLPSSRHAADENTLPFSDGVQPSLPLTPQEHDVLEIGPWLARPTPDLFPSSENMPPTPPDVGFLRRLPVSDPVAQHSATLVMQALRAFPQMMLRKATFPPFIHSHCHCYPLPEPLAHCMGIAHIFASSSIETRPFLWQSIKREQQRFLDEMTKMSKEDVLAAIQVQLIYIIMRVVDDAHQSAENNFQMLVTFQILCERFMKLCEEPFCLPEQWLPGSSWNDWVFAESRRRTACVWFLISRVVYVKTGISCDAIESFRSLPLACLKTLWEASTCEAWVSEYDLYGVTAPGAGLDNFGSLMESEKRCKEAAYARRLDMWNVQVDKLGSLLSVAVSMV